MSSPPPPTAARRPTTLERFGVTWSDDYAWLRDPAYPEVDRSRRSVAISRPRTPSSSATMAPHAAAGRASARRAQGADQGGRQLGAGARGRRSSIIGGSTEARSTGPGTGGRWAETEPTLILDEVAARRGQELLQPARARGQPRRPAARLHHRRGRLGALPAAPAAIWRPATELADLVANTSGSVEWAEDGRTLLYVELNDQLRPFRVRAHRLGDDPAGDAVLYEEDDPAFFVSIGKTRSRRLLLIATGTHVTREIRLLDAADPDSAVAAGGGAARRASLQPRPRAWPALDPDQRPARELPAGQRAGGGARASSTGARRSPATTTTICSASAASTEFMVLAERADGLADLRLRAYGGAEHVIPFPEPVYTVSLGDNREFVDRPRSASATPRWSRRPR